MKNVFGGRRPSLKSHLWRNDLF